MIGGDFLTQTIASAGAVLALVLLSCALGFFARPRLSGEDDVRAAITKEAPDAPLTEILIDARGRTALARLGDGRAVLVCTMGDRFAVRIAAAGKLTLRRTPAGIRAALDDAGFPPVFVRSASGAADAWFEGARA